MLHLKKMLTNKGNVNSKNPRAHFALQCWYVTAGDNSVVSVIKLRMLYIN